mmetsp:Transcript_29473/g.62564  ORF Transcript_29473/g.62564 Transcript_29473/m.62564 type:complete len:220 (-) Transcript_29473:225-884(-)|eukprot:CAMPEP_0172315556 /NCGR_PEP_ID=MMETSP1058-20130122/25529_1 /TAXON_ID=83371 /ORGANISM="Detonula confervacea, Strain CCMP 353" /LENGTH=219 /DNA_ID=CAMNT_0013029647 /DNA_START=222 /DNA_END=881 /DNA_ORIENTATION=+
MTISTMRFVFIASLLLAFSQFVVQSQDCANSGEKAKDCGAKGGIPWPCCDDNAGCASDGTCDDGDGEGGDCPTSLVLMCVGWVRGKSGKLHALIKVGGMYGDDTEATAINGANVVYETAFDGDFNTRVTTTTGNYIFKHYQNDFVASCDISDKSFNGVTENANCFETAPEGAECTVRVTSIKVPDCLDVSFETTDGPDADGTCVFAGREAYSSCIMPDV